MPPFQVIRRLGSSSVRAGGRIYERTPAGDEHEWGEVLVWEPPRRLSYLWHLRFDRADATEVEITFTPAGDRTTVAIVHRGWERLGAKGGRAPRAQPQGLGRCDRALPGCLCAGASVIPRPADYSGDPAGLTAVLAQA
jgi:uncharacterized protein YndB with AHSA1/START domain